MRSSIRRASPLSALLRGLLLVAALLAAGTALMPVARAAEAADTAADPALEKRLVQIASELRCLVCQNQTIADSHAELAVDLRNQVREMLKKGQSREQIIQYMTDRYGDFVLYRPPLKESTALLWFGPALLMVGGLVILTLVLRRRAKMAPDQFEPDDDPVSVLPAAAAASDPLIR